LITKADFQIKAAFFFIVFKQLNRSLKIRAGKSNKNKLERLRKIMNELKTMITK
jgi:hypothetical protein